MSPTYIGTSKLPGRTFGKRQVMTNTLGAWQVIGLFNFIQKKYGWRPTVNEGDRSRPDQAYMRDQYLYHGGALAAALYYSTHDPINYGDGLDIGGPTGAALTVTEHNILVNEGAAYGLFWTGRGFSRPEWWHFNIYPASATIKVPAGTKITGTISASSGTTTIIKKILSGDIEMKTITIKGGATFSVGIGHLVHHGTAANAILIDKVMDDGEIKTITHSQAVLLFRALNIPERWTDAVLFRKENKGAYYDRNNRIQTAVARLESAVAKLTPEK